MKNGKNLDKGKNLVIVVLGLLLIFGVSIGVRAQQVKSKIAELTELGQVVNADNKDIILAAMGFPSPELEDVAFGGSTSSDWNVGGGLTVTATTTLGINTLSQLDQALNFRATSTNTTSTVATGGTGNSDALLAFNYDNTNGDKWFTNWYIDIWSPVQAGSDNEVLPFSMKCGTTTLSSGTAYAVTTSYVATTTATILASSTIAQTYMSGESGNDIGVFYNDSVLQGAKPDNYAGSKFGTYFYGDIKDGPLGHATSTDRFLLKSGESFICSYAPYQATSSASFVGGTGSNALKARFHADVRARSN